MVQQNSVTAPHTQTEPETPTHVKWVEALPQLGYIVRGLLYATVGFLALQVALGAGGMTTDIPGAIATTGTQGLGKLTLAIIALGLIGYSLWVL